MPNSDFLHELVQLLKGMDPLAAACVILTIGIAWNLPKILKVIFDYRLKDKELDAKIARESRRLDVDIAKKLDTIQKTGAKARSGDEK